MPYLAALEEEVYRGRDEIETMWREVLRDVPDFQIELVDVVAEAADTVLIKVDFLGMGRASGAAVRTRGATSYPPPTGAARDGLEGG